MVLHNQIDHVLVDKRRQSIIINILSLRGSNCDTDYCLVVAIIRERLSLKNGIKQYLVGHRYNLNKLLDNETRIDSTTNRHCIKQGFGTLENECKALKDI